MEHTSISSNSTHTDLILSTFLSVKETIMLTESNQNPRNSILWVGCKTDFIGWTVKPKESKTWQVAIIALWQSCSVSPCKRVPSMNANIVTQTPQTRQSWFRSLVKIRGESRNPCGRARNSYNFPWKTNPKNLIFWRNFYREISIF